MRVAECFKPCLDGADFDFRREIDEVAGDGQMIGLLAAYMVDQQFKRIAKQMLASVAMPVHITCDPLGKEIPNRNLWQRAKMDIGNMGKLEHGR